MRLFVLTKLFIQQQQQQQNLPKFQWELYHFHHKGENNTCIRSSLCGFTIFETEKAVVILTCIHKYPLKTWAH
jgi:hypothetical protein